MKDESQEYARYEETKCHILRNVYSWGPMLLKYFILLIYERPSSVYNSLLR